MLVERPENKVASTISTAIIDASGSSERLNRYERCATEHAGRMFIVKWGDAKLFRKSEEQFARFALSQSAETVRQSPRTDSVGVE